MNSIDWLGKQLARMHLIDELCFIFNKKVIRLTKLTLQPISNNLEEKNQFGEFVGNPLSVPKS